MKVKISQLIETLPILNNILNPAHRPRSAMVTSNLNKLRKGLSAAIGAQSPYAMTEREWLDKLAKKDKDGKPLILEGAVIFNSPEDEAEFNAQIAPVRDEEVELECKPFTLGGVDLIGMEVPLSWPELEAISWLIDESHDNH